MSVTDTDHAPQFDSDSAPPFDSDICPYRRSARYIYDLFIAGDPETLEEDLAYAALDAIEQRDALRAVLAAAIDQIHDLNEKLDQERDTSARLRDELRACRAAQKAAA